MVEMLPHHATIFTKLLYEKGPKGLAEYLANDEPHRLALERTLTDIMSNRQDEPITLRELRNDVLCLDCPGQDGPYRLKGLGKHDKCDLATPGAQQMELKCRTRIRELTGKEDPTVREIYQASCEEWRKLKSGGR